MALTDIDGQRLGDSVAPKLSNRNKIINGAMLIDQRNDGSAVTVNSSTNYFAADRFKFGISSAPTGAGTIQQVSDGPDGFEKSNKFTVTTADSSIPATQSYNLMQEIEGRDVVELAWGTSAAKTITFSFYVKTSLNGTFGGAIQNSARDRSYPFTYAISSSEANTWVRREVTIPGDTSGTWLTDNGVGLRVLWGIGNGSSRVAAAGAWAASDARGATGQTQVIGTNSATFQVTGVQVEEGNNSTPFEHRSYSDELIKCKRYYHRSTAPGYQRPFQGLGLCGIYTDSIAFVNMNHDVEMRSQPTVDHETISDFQIIDGGGSGSITDITLSTSTEECTVLNIASSSAFTLTYSFILWSNTNGAWIDLDAEF